LNINFKLLASRFKTRKKLN